MEDEIQKRHANFLKLLRQGVQEKMEKESEEDACHGNQSRTWHTLSWRDAYSTAPYFRVDVNGKELCIHQLLQGELKGLGTGLTVWPAACVLTKYLERQTTLDVKNKFVLELGSGTGAVGLATAMLGADRVVITDVPELAFIMQENAELTQRTLPSTSTIQVESYDWGQPPPPTIIPDPTTSSSYPDLILVSDCVLPRLYPLQPLADALDRLTKAHTIIFMSYEHRHYEKFHPKEAFWQLLRDRGLVPRALESHEYHPHYQAEDIEIWHVTRSVGS